MMRWNTSLGQHSSVLCGGRHLVTLITHDLKAAHGTESVLLDKEGARQTVVVKTDCEFST